MDESETSDQELVHSVLEGNSQAFASLVDRYQNLVASAVWRYGGKTTEVEEVVQDIFVKTYRNLGQYRPDFAFSSWLYRLSANHVLDILRKQKRSPIKESLSDAVHEPQAEAKPTPEANEQAQLLRRALRSLKPKYREVVMAFYFEDTKVETIAKNLGLPQGTVKTRLMRGRKQLRTLLEKQHPELFSSETQNAL